MLQSLLRVFQPEQKLGAEGRAGDCRGDGGPAKWGDDGISETAAEAKVDEERDDIGKSFEEKMRMDGITADMKVTGEGDGMGCWVDGEL